MSPRGRRKGDIIEQARVEGRPISIEEGKKLFAPKPPTEQHDQIELVRQVRAHLSLYPDLANFTAIPNQGGNDRSAYLRGVMRLNEGMSPGYPDTLLDVARGGYFGLRLELKRGSGWNERANVPYARGEPTATQIGWLRRLASHGYLALVAWGWQPAWAWLHWYLRQPLTISITERETKPPIIRSRVYV